METVRLNVRVSHDVWRKLRDLAEEYKVFGKKSSVECIVQGFLAKALGMGAPPTKPEPGKMQGQQYEGQSPAPAPELGEVQLGQLGTTAEFEYDPESGASTAGQRASRSGAV